MNEIVDRVVAIQLKIGEVASARWKRTVKRMTATKTIQAQTH